MADSTTQTDNGDKKILLDIVTAVGKWTHPFPPETTIAELIQAVRDHFKDKLSPEEYAVRVKGGAEDLDPDATLAELGLKDKDCLTLIKATPGGGV